MGGAGCRNNRVGSAGVGVCAFHPCICAGCAGAEEWVWFAGVALSCCFGGFRHVGRWVGVDIG